MPEVIPFPKRTASMGDQSSNNLKPHSILEALDELPTIECEPPTISKYARMLLAQINQQLTHPQPIAEATSSDQSSYPSDHDSPVSHKTPEH